jgi:hypothetical protein
MFTRSKKHIIKKQNIFHLGPSRIHMKRNTKEHAIMVSDVNEYHMVFYRNGCWWGYKL